MHLRSAESRAVNVLISLTYSVACTCFGWTGIPPLERTPQLSPYGRIMGQEVEHGNDPTAVHPRV
jgi:hypothetical protein